MSHTKIKNIIHENSTTFKMLYFIQNEKSNLNYEKFNYLPTCICYNPIYQ